MTGSAYLSRTAGGPESSPRQLPISTGRRPPLSPLATMLGKSSSNGRSLRNLAEDRSRREGSSLIATVDVAVGRVAVLDRFNPHERGFLVVLLLDGGVANSQSRNRPDTSAFLLHRCDQRTLWFLAIRRSTRPLRLIQSLRRIAGPAFTPQAFPLCSDPRRAPRCRPPTSNCRPTTTAAFSVGRWSCW